MRVPPSTIALALCWLCACDEPSPPPEVDLSGIEERLDALDEKSEAYGARIDAAAPAIDQWAKADAAERKLAAKPRKRARPRPPAPPRRPLFGGVECQDSTTETNVKECRVPREHVEKIDPKAPLRTHGVWAPSYLTGELDGFLVVGIPSLSVLSSLQIENGDTVLAVDGNRLTSEEEALDVLARAKVADRLTLLVRRAEDPSKTTLYRIELTDPPLRRRPPTRLPSPR